MSKVKVLAEFVSSKAFLTVFYLTPCHYVNACLSSCLSLYLWEHQSCHIVPDIYGLLLILVVSSKSFCVNTDTWKVKDSVYNIDLRFSAVLSSCHLCPLWQHY